MYSSTSGCALFPALQCLPARRPAPAPYAATARFQQVDGRDDRTVVSPASGRRSAPCAHQCSIPVSGNKVLVLKRSFVTVHPDYADTRARYIFQNAFHHTQTRARRIGTTVIFTLIRSDFTAILPSMVTFPFPCRLSLHTSAGCLLRRRVHESVLVLMSFSASDPACV